MAERGSSRPRPSARHRCRCCRLRWKQPAPVLHWRSRGSSAQLEPSRSPALRRPRRQRPDLRGVVAARGDLDVRAAQDLDDRLDPERLALDDPMPVGVDVGDDHSVCGRAPRPRKKHSRSARSRSPASAPGSPPRAGEPLRLDRCRAQTGRRPRRPRPAGPTCAASSGCIPNCSATRSTAPTFVAGSRRNSSAIRVARSRSSSLYFFRHRLSSFIG